MAPAARQFILVCSRSIFFAAVLAAGFAIVPASSFADPPFWSVNVTADRSTMTPGQTAWFTATATGPSFYNSGYALELKDNATGNTIGFCGSDSCSGQVSSPWSANEQDDPPDISVSALVRGFGSSTEIASNMSTATVAVEPYEWQVDLSTSAPPTGEGYRATAGSTVTFTATADGVSLSNTGFILEVIDVETGQVLCWGNPSTTCTAALFLDWWRNSVNPLSTISVQARVRSMNNPSKIAGSSDPITVTVDRYEWNVGLVATPSAVSPGQTVTFTATSESTYATGYELVILDDITGAVLRTCAHGGTCSGSSFIPWSQNSDPQPLRIRAEVRNSSDSSDVAGLAGPISVDVQRFVWEVDLVSDRETMRPGETAWITASTNSTVQSTGYSIVLIDRETNQVFKTCASGTTCTGTMSVGWDQNGLVTRKRVRAEVRNDNVPSDVAGTSKSKSIYVDTYWHKVSLTATEPAAAGQDWTLAASAHPQISQLGYTLEIEKDDTGSIRTCSLLTLCNAGVGDGSYRAVVRSSSGKSYGESEAIIIDGSNSYPGSMDGIDLMELAAAIGSTRELCEFVLFGPTTHFQEPPSTVSDQHRTCTAGEAAGLSVHQILRLLAAGAGGGAVLWYLMDEVAGNHPQPAPGEEPEVNRPMPPPIVPDDFDSILDGVIAGNPGTDPQATEAILRNCYALLRKSGIGRNKCKSIPVFSSGTLDVPEATAHDRNSILGFNIGWAQLNYRPRKDTIAAGSPARWYKRYEPCIGPTPGQSCHEFPYFSTIQGGELATPRPRLKLIDPKQNQDQGFVHLNRFLQTCRITPGKAYLNIPAPPFPSPKQPSGFICNR